MKHTAQCKEASELAALEQYAWIEKWPNYCHNCNGAGLFSFSFDPSPAGVSLSAGFMTDVEPCESCTANGICPRCGKKAWLLLNDEEIPETPCLYCGWSWGKNADDYMPAMPECYCHETMLNWEQAEQALLRGEDY